MGCLYIFLALGYHFGGIISDKYNSKKLFFSIPIIAGTLLIGAYALINKITKLYFLMIPKVLDGSFILFLGSLLITLICFGLPILLLGMTSPYAIKLLNKDSTSLGFKSGLIYALSTLGSLTGILVTSLLLLPFKGYNFTFLISISILVLISTTGLLTQK